ncbi:MAG TPA: TrkA family potassium uptake protein [Anaerolineales bacterium]|nr:TrkA family potassium uptake protein [Anaerolineales bacterium]
MKVIIVGGGKVGAYLATLLLKEGHWLRVVELLPEQVLRLQKDLPPDVVVQGSGTDPNLLEAVGIHQVDVLAAVTGADEDNLVATSLARFEFNVPRTIARINNPKNAWMFTSEMGVDVALNQADLMGHLIAEEMSLGDMVTLLKLRKGQFSLIEEKVDPESIAAGKAIRELDLPAQCVFAAVIRKGELIIPRGDTVLQPADEVLAVVHASHLDDLAVLLGRQATLVEIN